MHEAESFGVMAGGGGRLLCPDSVQGKPLDCRSRCDREERVETVGLVVVLKRRESREKRKKGERRERGERREKPRIFCSPWSPSVLALDTQPALEGMRGNRALSREAKWTEHSTSCRPGWGILCPGACLGGHTGSLQRFA